MRPLFLVVLGSILLLGSVSGCDDKRVKECLRGCESQAEACAHKHESNCETRGKECAAACERK